MKPKHVAIIMDGNGRWASERGRPRFHGHIRGAKRVREIIRSAHDNQTEVLSLFAFSSENFGRPDAEKNLLWKLMLKFVADEEHELHKNNVRLHIVGDMSLLAPKLRNTLEEAQGRLQSSTGMNLVLAIAYGSQQEISYACKQIAEKVRDGLIDPKDVNSDLVNQHLWTSKLSSKMPIDLLIRTGGEQRLSNFMLWQCAYAEFLFTPVKWPDFTSTHFQEMIDVFKTRDRRFGNISKPKTETSLGT